MESNKRPRLEEELTVPILSTVPVAATVSIKTVVTTTAAPSVAATVLTFVALTVAFTTVATGSQTEAGPSSSAAVTIPSTARQAARDSMETLPEFPEVKGSFKWSTTNCLFAIEFC